MKAKACKNVGMDSEIIELPDTIDQSTLRNTILELNTKTDGILIQIPLPPQLDANKAMTEIDPNLDVDGLHPKNLGRVALSGMDAIFAPCTPKGCMVLLERYNIDVESKHCVIIGASNIVGKPLAFLLLSKHATVTICHIKTVNIKEHTRMADIIFVATGKAHLVKDDWVKKGVIIVDIGTTVVKNDKTNKNRIVGDVHPSAQEKASYLTPMPGGIGPMTIAMLIENTFNGFMRNHLKSNSNKCI
jgi:methylenetetrahydrofolate dehydrogenase (NADP+)/methenyltetrahydrofolate cyclohydrolase